ncbi:Hypothetical predicted protein [Lecanosticta acicola]|uniref:Uncharacterized protein n=1 Tax=Lecanosticta acicola TaxID=111012 RepID=A0AAI9EEU9_9PEZI|nr:Hypothetical predicted protein [Lecanosticta acicola]
MGHHHSKEQAHFRKLVAQKGLLKLPVGSEVERLFYEDFDGDAKEKGWESAGRTPVTPAGGSGEEVLKGSKAAAEVSGDRWAPVKLEQAKEEDPRTVAMDALVEQKNPSSRLQPVPIPLASEALAQSMQRTASDPGHSRPLAGMPQRGSSLCLGKTKSPSMLDPGYLPPSIPLATTTNNNNTTTTPETQYDAPTSRWQARISKRLSDRQANDDEKVRLSLQSPHQQISAEDRLRLSQITTAYSAIPIAGQGWEERVRISGSTLTGSGGAGIEGTMKEGREELVVRRVSSSVSSMAGEEGEKR